MTLAIAYATERVAFIACDTRRQLRDQLGIHDDGSAQYSPTVRRSWDAYGKIEPVGNRGWLMPRVALGPRALRPFSESIIGWPYAIDAGAPRYRRRLERLARRLGQRLDAANPHRPGGSLVCRSEILLVGARRRGLVLWWVDYGAGVVANRTGELLLHTPGDWPREPMDIYAWAGDAMRQAFPPGRRLVYELIRRLAGVHARVRDVLGPAGGVSDDVEIGILSRHGRALWTERLPPTVSRVVATADDRTLEAALQAFTLPALWGKLRLRRHQEGVR